MPAVIHDGDAILSQALKLASEKERDAYLTQACGEDAELRRRIEAQIAAHLQTGDWSKAPTVSAVNGAVPQRSDATQAETLQANHHGQASPKADSEKARRTERRSVLLVAMAVLMMTAAVGGIVLAFWAVRAEKEARLAVQKAEEERANALKDEQELKQQLEQAEAARKSMAEERDQAVEAEKAVKESAEDLKTVLSFFQRNVMSAGRPLGWPGGQGKDVSLRKAVDAAEAKVAAAFADRPIAEATIREMLGSTYLDLEAPEPAVKEYERAMALREALQGEDHPDTVACRNQLAVAYRLANRPVQAGRLYEPENNSSSHASALAIRGSIFLAQKKPAEAEKVLRECLAIREKIKPDDWSTFDAKSLLGEALLEQKKYAEAEPLLRQGYEGTKQQEAKIPSEDKFRLTKQLERLVRLYEAWGKQNEANRWVKELAKELDPLKHKSD